MIAWMVIGACQSSVLEVLQDLDSFLPLEGLASDDSLIHPVSSVMNPIGFLCFPCSSYNRFAAPHNHLVIHLLREDVVFLRMLA
ncbi:uncharacterized protein OCT59_002675 [Rhizophagus irregularis]|uniref:uncharacterized protein n=1 Tax=Rhizophagus irregularis TaxID=588596 RepID=UPI000CAD42B9|nr:hypothetical protein OCT59_002675 [Rhizophagus irregularis]GBC13737.1 hypothetical protein RIR_jg8847.t1 [Rhizophagus irregularis DAOM 181602=DAOM 197198]